VNVQAKLCALLEKWFASFSRSELKTAIGKSGLREK